MYRAEQFFSKDNYNLLLHGSLKEVSNEELISYLDDIANILSKESIDEWIIFNSEEKTIFYKIKNEIAKRLVN